MRALLPALILIPCSAFAQQFEVASVRASAPAPAQPGISLASDLMRRATSKGGPETDDPENLVIRRTPLHQLLWTAFGVRPDQISGPDWIDSEAFDITAKIPPGATKEQANLMLRNLLVERFKITFRHETKADTLSYELSVAKSGSKMKDAGSNDAPDPELPPRKPGDFLSVDHDANGFPIIPKGRTGIVATREAGGLYSMTCRACTVAEFIRRITTDLGSAEPGRGYAIAARIADKTGLAGKYDFHLAYFGGGAVGGALQPPPAGSQDPGPDIFSAVEKQLGLKIEKIKAPLDVLVIDHLERVPVEN